ncbi:MAG: hypothetical protein FJ207_15695 [Gemmatimonadetes bacterium]|nr:hypothetical protein [Gemmatimonadota bacterium]
MTEITQSQLVALALYTLGGAGTAVDTEDVAFRAHQMAPERFSWRKYPVQINLELVRVALNDARKKEAGRLVSGTGRSGWSLTVTGHRWAEQNLGRVKSANLSRRRQDRTAGSIDERRWQRERLRVLDTVAWRRWSEKQDRSDITSEAAADLYRVDRYVLGRAREMKVNRLRDMFHDDQELAPFLDAAATVLLSEGGGHDNSTD